MGIDGFDHLASARHAVAHMWSRPALARLVALAALARTVWSIFSRRKNGGSRKLPRDFGDIIASEGPTLPLTAVSLFSPVERLALTANGNLQRVMSALYGERVMVRVLESRRSSAREYTRTVHLESAGRGSFCVARSRVSLRDPALAAAVKGGQVGLGQLFRHYDILPKFKIVSFGRIGADGAWWRLYELDHPRICCRIREEFVAGAFSGIVRPKSFIKGNTASRNAAAAAAVVGRKRGNGGDGRSPAHFGDIMRGCVVDLSLPSGFSPFERVALTANGNLARIFESLHATPVRLCLLRNARVIDDPGGARFHRELELRVGNKIFCRVRNLVTVTSGAALGAIGRESGRVAGVFRATDRLPHFQLRAAGREAGGGIWREYTLESPGVVCDVREDFSADAFSLCL